MNRKEFLLSCGGLCACAAVGSASSVFAADKKTGKQEDWRLPFVQRRYAKLLEILLARFDEKTVGEILEQLGRSCAAEDPLVKKHKGDVEGFIRDFKKSSPEPIDISYDAEKGVVTIVGPERKECSCPLVDRRVAPKAVCCCSAGWHSYIYEIVSGKKVRPERLESVVHGDKRCAFRVYIEG